MNFIKLEVNDNILDKVMYFLNLLPQNDIKIKVENKLTENKHLMKHVADNSL